MGGNALEAAERAGKPINLLALKRARDYQQANVDAVSGAAKVSEAAGVELYSFAGAGRAFGGRAGRARQLVEQAKAEKRLPADAPVTAETIGIAGASSGEAKILADAVRKVQSRNARLSDENLLKGFGNNGGEEYLSYMLTSESLVIEGGQPWEDWNAKMHSRLEKIQSADGSWTGHHCITSPVFCTAAVLQTLTVERDIGRLRAATSSREAAAK
jgi:hypothetical protein